MATEHYRKQMQRQISEALHYWRRYQIIHQYYATHYQHYLKLLFKPYRSDKDEEMINPQFMEFLINDIISTDEYTFEGIAYQLRISKDALIDIVSGINRYPSYAIVFKLLDLHYAVRPMYYQ